MLTLSHEMARFRYCHRVLNTMLNRAIGKVKYDIEKIAEWWFIMVVNDGGLDQLYNLKHNRLSRLIEQHIVEKRIYINMNRVYSIPRIPEKPVRWRFYSDCLLIDEFKFRCCPKRLFLLRSMAPADHVAATIVRYECFFPKGQQWGVPNNVFKFLVDTLDIGLEGFASPFNSRMLPLNKKFCSLFPDTDSIFGSVGNIFDYDITNTRSILNPPFILTVIEKLVDKLLVSLEKSTSSLYVLYLPWWDDADYFTKLQESQYKLDLWKLDENTYLYENHLGAKIRANFKSAVFIMGTPDIKIDLEDVRIQMMKLYN